MSSPGLFCSYPKTPYWCIRSGYLDTRVGWTSTMAQIFLLEKQRWKYLWSKWKFRKAPLISAYYLPSPPPGDYALEAFISACNDEFLDCGNRRKIRDDMTPNQRLALKEMRTLPLTHNAACRFADKSGVTVITSLEKDDCAIKNLCKTLIFLWYSERRSFRSHQKYHY